MVLVGVCTNCDTDSTHPHSSSSEIAFGQACRACTLLHLHVLILTQIWQGVMKRKFGTEIAPSSVGNPIARTMQRVEQTLIRAQARIRGMLSRIALTVQSDAVIRRDWAIMNQPSWFQPPR